MTATPERRSMLLRELAQHVLLAKFFAVKAGELAVCLVVTHLQPL
jgi:hypothetical protein